MIEILGIVMIYSWVHALVIIFNKLKGLTQYETIVSIVALTAFILLVVGTMM